MPAPYRPGDVVQHKGVLKTVAKVINDALYCQWFVGDKLYQKWIGAHYVKPS